MLLLLEPVVDLDLFIVSRWLIDKLMTTEQAFLQRGIHWNLSALQELPVLLRGVNWYQEVLGTHYGVLMNLPVQVLHHFKAWLQTLVGNIGVVLRSGLNDQINLGSLVGRKGFRSNKDDETDILVLLLPQESLLLWNHLLKCLASGPTDGGHFGNNRLLVVHKDSDQTNLLGEIDLELASARLEGIQELILVFLVCAIHGGR